MKETIVVALGGNALSRGKTPEPFEKQSERLFRTSFQLVELAKKFSLVVTHGNGPQVGAALMRSEYAMDVLPFTPLPVCGAQSQGEIGFLIARSLGNEFKKKGMRKDVSVLLTQVLVNSKDPAFFSPSKPIGPVYSREEAKEKEKAGWKIVLQEGKGYRRVVPSPEPKEIIELDSVRRLLGAGKIVVAAGGGGVPVVKGKKGWKGVDAVIDKDKTSSLLAQKLNAQKLLILTDVEKAALNYGKPNQKWLSKISVEEAKEYLKEGHFPEGSMKPKIESAIRFSEKGKTSIITSLSSAMKALKGKAGTHITGKKP